MSTRHSARLARKSSKRGLNSPATCFFAALHESWAHAELAPYYSHLGRPSIDPVLMLQMLIVGYVSAIMNVIGIRPLIAAMSLPL